MDLPGSRSTARSRKKRWNGVARRPAVAPSPKSGKAWDGHELRGHLDAFRGGRFGCPVDRGGPAVLFPEPLSGVLMADLPYRIVIGLEVHVQLLTRTKLF